MSHEVAWTKLILEEFIKEALLTEDEEIIIRTRIAGWSRQKQADTLNISVSSVDKIIKKLKLKYDEVQKYDPLIPPRQAKSVKNTFAKL